MSEENRGDIDALCGLLSSLESLAALLQHTPAKLDDYPLVGCWTAIFDDFRIVDFSDRLAGRYGLPGDSCETLQALVVDLEVSDKAGKIEHEEAARIVVAIRQLLRSSREWRKRMCGTPKVYA